jgi:hypothetical protein
MRSKAGLANSLLKIEMNFEKKIARVMPHTASSKTGKSSGIS